MMIRTKLAGTLLAMAATLALPACDLPNLISALDGPYYRISGGTNLYVTIKRNATEELYYHQFLCQLNGSTPQECAEFVLAMAAITIEANLDPNGAVRWVWDNRVRHAFAADEAGDFLQALGDLPGRQHECLRISIRSGENWTTVDQGLAECSWGEDPFPDNEV